MRYSLRPWNAGLTEQELLADLRKVALKLGKKTVTATEYAAHGRCSAYLFHNRFGSWNKALAAAGLELSHRYRVPAAELLENLERVWHSLGRQPASSDMVRPLSAFSTGPYNARFGGWRAALKEFVAWANSRGEAPAEAAPGAEPPRRPPRTAGPALRLAVFKRDHYRCTVCGRSPATDSTVELHLDHRIPWSLGGETTMENLATLCRQCNRRKSNTEPRENGAKYSIS